MQKHSRAIAFSDGANNSSDSNLLSPARFDLEHPSLDSESFQSPNKAAYRELIKQSNQQNSGVSFEQMTRNSSNAGRNAQTANNHLYDRNQLSVVEEENFS